MKEFIKQMMSESSDVSSKRVNGTICLIAFFGYLAFYCISMIFMGPEKIIVIQNSFVPVSTFLGILIGAFFGLSSLDKLIK